MELRTRLNHPQIFDGNVYAAESIAFVPKSLEAACDVFAHSDFVQSVLGEDVTRHYAHFFRVEHEAFANAVTDWERQRYFERI